MSRTFPAACAALLAALACTPLSARPPVKVAIVDRDAGGWLAQYRHAGDAWVAGVPGHRYAVRLANTSGERVLVVLSVDGVNAVTGEDADPYHQRVFGVGAPVEALLDAGLGEVAWAIWEPLLSGAERVGPL